MRPSAVVVAVTLAVVAAGCGTTPPLEGHQPDVITADPAGHAQAEADRLMSLVHVPSGAATAEHSPAGALDQPWQTTATDDIVDEHRWWTLSWDAATALSWLRRHGVTGHHSDGSGTSGGPGGVESYNLMFSNRSPTGISSETLLLTVAPMGDDTSAIRADAQVVWLPGKPADSLIPRNVERLDVSAFRSTDELGHRTLTGSDARHLARIINALPTAARAEHTCGADVGYRLRVVAGPLVFDDDVACFDISVTDGGQRLPVLAASQRFVRTVASSMGLPDHLRPSRESPAPTQS